jgi:hypothetical protein
VRLQIHLVGNGNERDLIAEHRGKLSTKEKPKISAIAQRTYVDEQASHEETLGGALWLA